MATSNKAYIVLGNKIIDPAPRPILAMMVDHKITLAHLIDEFIETQGIVGVGLITLQDDLKAIVEKHFRGARS